MTRESAARDMNAGVDLDAFEWKAHLHEGRPALTLHNKKSDQRTLIAVSPSWERTVAKARQWLSTG